MIKSVMVDCAEAVKMMVDGVKVWERSGLPSGYQICKYLEGSGTQYIDTGIVDDGQTDFDITCSYTSGGNDFPAVFGARVGSDKIVALMYASNTYLYVSSNRMVYVNNIFTKHTYHFYSNQRYWEVLDENRTSEINCCTTTNLSVYLFGMNWIGPARKSKTKIYGFNSIRSNTIIQNLIPALDSSGVPCMYDTVSKQPFYNHGTGEFLFELA